MTQIFIFNQTISRYIPITTVISGGKISKIRLEHLWVEAAIDFYPSRGAKNRAADSWVQFNPSFRQYDILPGLDAVAISGIDPQQLVTDFTNSGTMNEAEGWVTGFDPTLLEQAQSQAQTALEDYITNNLQNPTVGDVIGGRKTIIQDFPVLPSSLPNRIVTAGVRYDKLPTALQQTVGYSFNNDNFLTFPWSRLNNEKVTLSFTSATPDDEATLTALLPEGEITDISQLPSSIPAYLIQVIPELKVNGDIVKTGSPMSLGEELDFITDIRLAGRGQVTAPRTYKAIAGSYLSVNVVAGSISTDKLAMLQRKLEQTLVILNSGDSTLINALTPDQLLGDLFYSGTLSYFSQLAGMSRMIALQNRSQFYLAAGTGTIGYEPTVDTFFGIPRSIKLGGVVFDIPFIQVSAANNGDREKQKQFNQQVGMLSSALEYATPEQMFDTDSNNSQDAISAVKAIVKANAEGQRIYQITQANQAAVLPNIHHDQVTMDEIRASLNTGKTVITHADSVSIPGGWNGAGYIILDPVTSVGAYKISGGINGGNDSDPILALSLSLATLGSTADGYASDLADNNLPLSKDLAKYRMAKKIAKAGKLLGGAALVVDIVSVLGDSSLSISNKVGRIAVAMFGFGVGAVAGAAIVTAFVPIAAALIAAVFVATLTIVLADFSLIYFSLLLGRRLKFV